MRKVMTGFPVKDYAMRYTMFAPRLFNYCLSLGMKPQQIMPSRAFCSDENQGYPIILITKHFGTFPFNHGRVGGIVATDRHGPHAEHGTDLVIIQASHVGYEPQNGEFGIYRRLQTEDHEHAGNCGAICGVLNWYQTEYENASQHVRLGMLDGNKVIYIDNQLVSEEREQGLFLNMEKMIADANALQALSTSKIFRAADDLIARVGDDWPDQLASIGKYLQADLFYFKKEMEGMFEASGFLNRNLIKSMPEIITHRHPPLLAAEVNAQIEFDRTYRTLINEKAYQGKKLVFISGVNVDVSPTMEMRFPLTKFIPWAAYIRDENGNDTILEQDALYQVLVEQSAENPHKIDLTEAIHKMENEPEIKLDVNDE